MRCATGQQSSGKHGTFTGNQHHFKAKCFQFLSKGIHKNIDNRHNLFHIFIMAVTSMRKKTIVETGHRAHSAAVSTRVVGRNAVFQAKSGLSC